MNKDIIKGHWKEIKGKLKQTWGKLTDDDVMKMEGSHDELCGLLEKKYGYNIEKAQKEIQRFIDNNGLPS